VRHIRPVTSHNVRVVRGGIEAFIRGDVERALEMVHPDIVSVRTAPLPDPQTYHGPDGVLRMHAEWTADFEDFEIHDGRRQGRSPGRVRLAGAGRRGGGPALAGGADRQVRSIPCAA
jgi:ketosteroid isomerase-like protein